MGTKASSITFGELIVKKVIYSNDNIYINIFEIYAKYVSIIHFNIFIIKYIIILKHIKNMTYN